MDSFDIAGLPIGTGQRCITIAEAGLNHNGDINLALQLIESAAQSGASIVKFQKRHVDDMAVGSVLDATDARFPAFGGTYRQIREHLEFSWDEYVRLRDAAHARKLRFMVTPFDAPSLQFLEKLEVPAYKIASHSATNLPLLEQVAEIGKPVIMSTGMCSWDELDRAVERFQKRKTPLVLLHCVSAYPTPPEAANLSLIPVLRARYGVPVGFSGHEVGFWITLAAVALGAVVVERHFTMDRNMMGFDHKLSLNPSEFAAMVQAIDEITRALGDGKKTVSDREMITRLKYHVSAVSRRAIAAGERISEEMIAFKNPGTGIPPHRLSELLGRRARSAIAVDTLLSTDMVES